MLSNQSPFRALPLFTALLVLAAAAVGSPAQASFIVLPLPVGHGPIDPDEVVELSTTTAVAPGFSEDLRRISSNGISAGDFTVPEGKVLVIQSVQVFPETLGGGRVNVQLVQNALVRNFWVLPQAAPTFIPLSPGLIVDAGFSLDIANGAVSSSSVRATAYGYLTDE